MIRRQGKLKDEYANMVTPTAIASSTSLTAPTAVASSTNWAAPTVPTTNSFTSLTGQPITQDGTYRVQGRISTDHPLYQRILRSRYTQFGTGGYDYSTGRLGRASDIGLPPTVHRVEQTPPTDTRFLPTIMAQADNRIDNLPKEELPSAANDIDWNQVPEYNRINPDDSIMTQRAKIKAAMKFKKGFLGRGRYGRFIPAIAAMTGGQALRTFIWNKIRTKIVQFVASRYGPIKAAEVNAWIQTNTPRIAKALEVAGVTSDIYDACDIVARMISGELDLPGLAIEIGEYLGTSLGGKLARHLGLGTGAAEPTSTTDRDVDSLTSAEVVEELGKYDLTNVPVQSS